MAQRQLVEQVVQICSRPADSTTPSLTTAAKPAYTLLARRGLCEMPAKAQGAKAGGAAEAASKLWASC